MLNFDSQFTTFDPVNLLGSVSVTVTWSPPEEPNGVLVNHTLRLFQTSTSTNVTSVTLGGAVTSASLTVTVAPYTEYRVEVSAVLGNSESSTTMSDAQFSPEAGKPVCQVLKEFYHPITLL